MIVKRSKKTAQTDLKKEMYIWWRLNNKLTKTEQKLTKTDRNGPNLTQNINTYRTEMDQNKEEQTKTDRNGPKLTQNK